MKKVVIATAAVLALGLAACQDNAADNNASAVNTVENEAEADVNAAADNTAAAADQALNAADNAVENAGEAIENAAEAVSDSTTNQ